MAKGRGFEGGYAFASESAGGIGLDEKLAGSSGLAGWLASGLCAKVL